MTQEMLDTLSNQELKAIVLSTAPHGQFWQQLIWAKRVLRIRLVERFRAKEINRRYWASEKEPVDFDYQPGFTGGCPLYC